MIRIQEGENILDVFKEPPVFPQNPHTYMDPDANIGTSQRGHLLRLLFASYIPLRAFQLSTLTRLAAAPACNHSLPSLFLPHHCVLMCTFRSSYKMSTILKTWGEGGGHPKIVNNPVDQRALWSKCVAEEYVHKNTPVQASPGATAGPLCT
jgi:hypothetical protein